MKISFSRKVILHFPIFMIVSLVILILSYYSHYVLNQKLQVVEKKDILFNTILEARRYEKNYFLYLKKEHVQKALFYAQDAKKKLFDILDKYRKYTFSQSLEKILFDLQHYERYLTTLLELHKLYGNFSVAVESFDMVRKHHEGIKYHGRKITVKLEELVRQDRKYVHNLIQKSKIYHLIALAAILILSVITTLFLIINVNRPLKSIEDAINKIAKGDYRNIPGISTGDEFESLVTSLNIMLDQLNKRSEQLVQTEKLASLGTLTSGVAHELNNPLNNISTSVQILLEELEEPDSEYKRNLLVDTEKQVERARDTVKALLEFSRRRTFEPEPVNFKDLVDNTIRLIKGEVPSSVNVTVDMPEDIRVNIDVHRIQQVLINLIINAVQAMEGGGDLTIRASKLSATNMLFFQVEDTGEGISEEVFPKIFDPFFTTKDVGKGTGLGLSTSHGIIQQHGGRIEGFSTPGKGTLFNVYLPA